MVGEEKKWWTTAKRWAVLFGIPLVMLMIGVWQWSRLDSVASVGAQIAQYQEAIAELDAIQAQDRRSIAFVKDNKGRSVPVTLLKDRYQTAIRDLQNGGVNATSRDVQPVLAAGAITFSVLALLWSALGLVYQQRIGKQALQSREQLLAVFERGRKLLPTYMVVMVLLLFAAAIPLLVYEMMPILRHTNYRKGDVKLMLVLGGLALFLFYAGGKLLWDVWSASRRPMENEPIEVMGQAVSRDQAPELWAFVDRVAGKTGAGMPDSIVVGLNEGFFVTEHPVQLTSGSLLPHGRVLYLPLPYMAFLNASEVAAVIGHELGHFLGEDTLYSQRFSPIYSATIKHLVAISGGDAQDSSWMDILRKPATMFGEMFLDSFHEAVRFWSRKRELAADAVGAGVVNPQAVASSLLRITALEPHVNEALEMHWDQGQTLEGGIVGHVRQLVAAKGMVDPSQHLENRQSHPTDTHPELAVRLDALGVPVGAELLQRAMDPQGSRLLQEFGLERGALQTGAGRTMASAVAPAPAADINSSLQQELTGLAAAQRSQKIEELTAMVDLVRNPYQVRERIWLILCMTLGSVALFATMTVFALKDLKGDKGMSFFIFCLVMALGSLAWMYMVVMRSRQAPMVLELDGIRLFGGQQVLSWADIHDYHFTETNRTFEIKLILNEGVEPPRFKVFKLRGAYARRLRQLRVTLLGVGGKRGEKLAEAIMNYSHGYFAREELRRMGVPV